MKSFKITPSPEPDYKGRKWYQIRKQSTREIGRSGLVLLLFGIILKGGAIGDVLVFLGFVILIAYGYRRIRKIP